MNKTETAEALSIGEIIAPRRPNQTKSFFAASLERFFRSKLNWFALILFGLIVLLSVTAPFISSTILRVAPERTNIYDNFKAPGFVEKTRDGLTIVHWLGTDEIGRDTLSRLLHAGNSSLAVAFLSTLISFLIGIPLGMAAAYFGGWIDDVMNAIIQVIINVPTLYLLVILTNIFRPSVFFLALFFGLLGWTYEARQARGLTLSLKKRDFIDASKVMGASNSRVIFSHILPNVISIVLVLAGFSVAGVILSEAGLSFLGYGVQDPDVSWGKMLNKSSEYLTYSKNENPFLIIGPGIMIFVTVLSVYLIADGLRDAFDPSLKQ
jgi:peptide/nickel transport system permease protein